MEIASRLTKFERPAMRPGLRSWLYTLVRSKSCNILQNQARRRVESLEVVHLSSDEATDEKSPDPADAVERQWKRALLETLLAEIRQEVSAKNWRLLQMRFHEGAEVAEIAAELGLTSEEVRYRQRRLLKKLKMRAAAFTGESVAG
jgi:RNA polymerase sigma factor (sigma-70 family)